jgi:hypothetical protein
MCMTIWGSGSSFLQVVSDDINKALRQHVMLIPDDVEIRMIDRRVFRHTTPADWQKVQ